MTRLTELEEERLRPQPRQITPGQLVAEALGQLIHLIAAECLRSDAAGRGRRLFNKGDEATWPGFQQGGKLA